jgi:hypothetical protein
MKIVERRMEDIKPAVLVVAREIRFAVFEMTAIRGCQIVFRIKPLGLGRILEVFVGAETRINDNGFSEFFLSDAVDSLEQAIPSNTV